jgi:acetate kinase
MEQENLSTQQIGKILMSKGGIYGISGISGDFRDIEQGMNKGDKRCELAFKTFVYNVKRYIGEYLVALNGADCIVFTAGAGEHSARLRKAILANMENLGIVLDEGKNNANPTEGIISHDSSRIKVAVIPTNEELVVASEVKRYLEQRHPSGAGDTIPRGERSLAG